MHSYLCNNVQIMIGTKYDNLIFEKPTHKKYKSGTKH